MSLLTRTLSLAGLAVTAGCTKSASTLEGRVRLKNEDIQYGSMRFMISSDQPTDPDNPNVGARIVAGKYTVPADQNLKPGRYRVGIRAGKATGRKVKDPESGAMVDEFKECLPAKYNTDTKLTAEIKSGANTIDFNLE